MSGKEGLNRRNRQEKDEGTALTVKQMFFNFYPEKSNGHAKGKQSLPSCFGEVKNRIVNCGEIKDVKTNNRVFRWRRVGALIMGGGEKISVKKGLSFHDSLRARLVNGAESKNKKEKKKGGGGGPLS